MTYAVCTECDFEASTFDEYKKHRAETGHNMEKD